MSDFKSALLTLRDEAFFELVRNYLGPVKTPFNKHDLIARLEGFLRKETIQNRIVGLIDDEDAELLTAIWMLGEPDFDEIHLFFARQRSYLDLHQRLLNLEDRLLIYRAGEHLRINPILLERLEESVLRVESLFASRERLDTDPEPRSPWVSDTLLIALHSYLCEGPEVFRADRSLRKRALNDLRERLPVIIEPAVHPEGQLRATPLLEALLAAGAVVEESGLYPVSDIWDELAALSPLQRIVAVVAAIAGEEDDPGSLAPAIEGVVTTLPSGRAMSTISVERLLLVLAPDQSAETCRRAREMMTVAGLLIPVDEEFVLLAELPEEHEERKPLVVQPNFELTMPEEFSFADGLLVARISKLRRHDRYPRFELTKERVAASLRNGLDIETIIDRLTSLAGGQLPQNIVVTMQSWAGEHESVRLFKGVVLTVEEARRPVVEHAASVQGLVRERLAPGVYLIDERDVEAMQSALEDAGVELVPEIAATPRRGTAPIRVESRKLIDHGRLATFSRVFRVTGEKRAPARPISRDWLEDIQKRLDEKSLTPEQREELAGRVRNKLILGVEQVRPDTFKTEKTEARGLDYVGKVRIIEQAIRTGSSLLEIIERSEDGSPHRRLVEPIEMNKRENELVLVGEELPRRSRVELLVRKLGLVRRLRSGLVKRRARHR
ncbi:MAG: hypothetical protein ACOC2Q_01740 [Spirochaetota bacterium]